MGTAKESASFDSGMLVGFFGGLIFCVAIVGFIVVPGVREDARVPTICDYLHAKHQGDICVKDGIVVYPKGK